MANCPLCDSTNVQVGPVSDRDIYGVRCEACGRFLITPEALDLIQHRGYPEKRFILSALARAGSDAKKPLEFYAATVEELISQTPLPATPFAVLDQLLLLIHRLQPTLTGATVIERVDYPLFFLRSQAELGQFIKQLAGLGYITTGHHEKGWQCALTLDGWRRVPELKRSGKASVQAFVAMSFMTELEAAWRDAIGPALVEAGWTPLRVDVLEHNEKICDRILVEIRRSGLLVADFTGNRSGVYFEAGFAMGLALPVIWTVQSADLQAVHFDTRQYNHIVWNEPSDLRTKLYNRVVATVPAPHQDGA